MKKGNIVVKLLVFFLLSACSKLDDSPVAAPDISYGQEITAAFFAEGQSEAPEIDWNGDVGQFGLKNASSIFSIDPVTGIVSWNNKLGLGIHELEILAFNNAGTTQTVLNINGVLEGRFNGDYYPESVIASTSFYELEYVFNRDGTLTGFQRYQIEGGEIQGPFNFEGTWSEDDLLFGEYKFEEVGAPVAFLAALTVSDSGARLTGNYIDTFVDPDAVINFKLEFVP